MKHFFDMDDTLADFHSELNAMKRFDNERDFFTNLKPTTLVNIIKDLPHDIYILSCSPNEQADKDKLKWLEKHLPMVKPENVYLVRTNEEKAKLAKGNLLIDDHTSNLVQWIKQGGYGIKVINYHNYKKGRSKALNLATIKVS